MTQSAEITPLRIGFDAIRLFTGNSGLANYAKNLLISLKNNYPQHKYYLYTPRIEERNENISMLEDPAFVLRAYKGSFGLMWRAKSICKDIKSDKLDIFHGLSIELPFGIEKTKTKSVATIHDVLWREFPQDYRFYYKNILEYKLSHALKIADHIISVSQTTSDALLRDKNYQHHKSSVIYQVPSPEFYHTPSQESTNKVRSKYNLPDNFILAVGSYMGRKNISYLLDTFSKMDTAETHLIIVGEGRANAHNVRFIQNVLSHEMPGLYVLSAGSVYPSLGEGYGLPIVESLLMERPVVVFDKAPMNEFDSDLVNKYTLEQGSLKVAIQNMLSRGSNVKGEKFKAKSYKIYAEELMSIYTHL